MPVEAGIKFGQYLLLRRLARGGMAEVFLAQQRGLEGFDRRVAIKRILPHLADSSEFVQMFLAEAKLAAQLSHPNIVHIYDFGKVEDDYFIAMEYVEGVHAGQLATGDDSVPTLPRERLPPALVARLGADAAAALHNAHELRSAQGKTLGLVHRDVSPANIMISYDGVVKLCDFGIAKAAAVSDRLTNPGQVKGKYAYMSPEQTTGSALDGRSDVFSLAIVLWELLAGRFIVPRGDPVKAMRAIRDGKLEPLATAAPGTPAPLVDAIAWALENDRDRRATAAELAQALEAFIKGSPQLATPMQLATWVRRWFPRETTGDGPALVTPVGTEARSRTQGTMTPPEMITPERLIGASRVAAEEISGPDSGTSIYVTPSDLIEGDTIDRKPITGGTTLLDPNGPDAPTAIAGPLAGGRRGREDEHDTIEQGLMDMPGLVTPPVRPSPTAIVTPASGPRNMPAVPSHGLPTRHVLPIDRQHRLRIAAAIGGLVGLALISFAIALAAKSKHRPDAAPPDAAPVAHAQLPQQQQPQPPPPPPLDAARLDAPAVAAAIDAAVPKPAPGDAAPPADAPAVETSDDAAPAGEPHHAHGMGRLNVRTSPHAEVFENGKKLGETPIADRELSAGKHVLTFKSPLHPTVTKTVIITPGKVAKLSFDLP